jgi:hypothetical protein
MMANEQTAQFTRASAAGIKIQLAFGTRHGLDQRHFAGDAVRIFPAKSALGR